jgi:hypothetical protein
MVIMKSRNEFHSIPARTQAMDHKASGIPAKNPPFRDFMPHAVGQQQQACSANDALPQRECDSDLIVVLDMEISHFLFTLY